MLIGLMPQSALAEDEYEWQTVGSAGFSAGSAYFTSLYMYEGTPYVAYKDGANSSKATVMKYTGAGETGWETVGSAGFSAGQAYYTSLYVYEGTPYIAYEDGDNSYKATVMKYTGAGETGWEIVGSAGFSAGQAYFTSLYIYEGTPYVAYKDGANSGKATVMKYESGSWRNVGSAGFSAGAISNLSLYMYDNTPYVSYRDNSIGKATVMKYESGSWKNVGSRGFSAGNVFYTSLYVYNGTPYVAYSDYGNAYEATVMKYTGAGETGWELVGSANFSAGSADDISLYVYDGTPYVAYRDIINSSKATVMKYTGEGETGWEAVGSAGFSAGVKYTSLYVYNGTPYVAYCDPSYKATVMYYGEIPATPPTLTSINTLTGAEEDTAYEITYDALAAAADESDAEGDAISFRVESVTSGTLTKDGTTVTAGTTLLGDDESLVWTPAADANGTLDAFTVKAYDGTDASESAVQVKVSVAAVNDAPAGIPTISGTVAAGETLSAVTGDVTDAEGLGMFHYQWQLSATGLGIWTDIGTDSAAYELTADDMENYVCIRVAVSYTDGEGTDETVYSAATMIATEYGWQNVGIAGFSANRASVTTLYVYEGTPYIAYEDGDNSYKATVMKYTGAGETGWELVGSPDFSAGGAYNLSLYVYDGAPYVVYRDTANSYKATVMKYTGEGATGWQSVGSIGFSAGDVYAPSLYVYEGTPYVAYQDGGNSNKATVMKYTGEGATGWQAVGSAGFSVSGVYDPSLYVYNGTPYVAYRDSNKSHKATVMKYTGEGATGWQSVGSIGFSASVAYDISLYVYDGMPYVAYMDGGDMCKATVMKYEDGSWQNVGSAGFSAGSAYTPSLCGYDGTLYVAYRDGINSSKATVMKYTGEGATGWQAVGSAGFSSGSAYTTSLYVYDGTPYVAYQDGGNSSKATVMYYAGDIPATPPTLTSISTLTGAEEDTAYEITYDALATAADEFDAESDTISFRVESVTSGTLTKDGTAVTAGTTLLGDDESLVWTPAADANGTLDAFTVKAYDGTDASESAVQVKVSVAAVNDAPAGIPTISGTVIVGETLNAVTGNTTDADGLGALHYQWQLSATGLDTWTNIGTDCAAYELTADDAGNYVRVAVSYTDGEGTDETVYSAASMISKKSAVTLTADTTGNSVDEDIVITFAADSGFASAITGVSYDGNALNADQYTADTVNNNKITLHPGADGNAYMRTPGTADVVVTASGYEDASVSQTITAGMAASMTVTTQPEPGAVSGDAFSSQPVITLYDQYDNVCSTGSSASASVTASAKAGTGEWTIGGTASVTASSGVTAFTDLTCTLESNGTGAVTFSCGSLSVDSDSFTIPAISDADAVAAAKDALKDGSVDVAYGATQADKTAAVQSYVNGLLGDVSDAAGVTATVAYNSGTGKYDVTISKGGISDSKSLSMTVNVAEKETSTTTLTSGMVSGIADRTYTGSALKPAVTVINRGTTLTKGTDYTVSYLNNTNAGIATAIIRGKGDYTGTVWKMFTINKAGTAVTELPMASDILVVGKLSDSALTDGSGSVDGTFAWTDPDAVISETGEYSVTFMPESANYDSCTCGVSLTVNKQASDSETGVIYDFSDTDLPDGVSSISMIVSLVAQEGADNDANTIISGLLDANSPSSDATDMILYDLSLVDQDGNPITGFAGTITVRIPIPEGMSGDLHVYWYDEDNGTLADMNATRQDGYLYFSTNHFSIYAITAPDSSSSESGTGSNTLLIIVLALLGAALCVLIIMITLRKKHKKDAE
jgi:hypothetical protein